MFGIELFNWPSNGLGGGSKFGVIPPFASGIYGGAEVFENLSFALTNGAGGLCKSNGGILLELFGLFYANKR